LAPALQPPPPPPPPLLLLLERERSRAEVGARQLAREIR